MKMNLSRKHESGMTLIEILVVLVLIGVVLGIVGGNFIGRGEKAKADAAKIANSTSPTGSNNHCSFPHPSMHRRLHQSHAAGVSLLELLIVIALIALVAGMVLPTFGNGVPTSELKAAARQLAAGLRIAR